MAKKWRHTSLYELVMVEEVEDRIDVKILDVLKEAARGLAAIHSYQYAHQNLKASNVLISKRMEQLVVVISDLGRSKMQGENQAEDISKDLLHFEGLICFALSDAARLAPDWKTFLNDKASWNVDGLEDESDRYLARNLIKRLRHQTHQYNFSSALIEHQPLFWKDHSKLEYISAISEQFGGKNQYLKEKDLLEHNASGVITTDFSEQEGTLPGGRAQWCAPLWNPSHSVPEALHKPIPRSSYFHFILDSQSDCFSGPEGDQSTLRCPQLMVEEVRDRMGVNMLEVLNGASKALAAVHRARIAHRNLKPSNALISVQHGDLVVVISDFGTSDKQKKEGLTTAISKDLKQFAKLIQFSLSESGRSAADWTSFDSNRKSWSIEGMQNQSDMFLAENLISKLAPKKWKFLLPSDHIHQHPLFWKDHLKLENLWEISEQYYKTNGTDPERELLEKDAQSVIGADFSTGLVSQMQAQVRSRNFDTSTVYDLIRFIRNKKAHFHEDLSNGTHPIGAQPTQFLAHFTTNFQKLLTHVYCDTQYMAHDPSFEKYFSPEMSCYTSLTDQHTEWIVEGLEIESDKHLAENLIAKLTYQHPQYRLPSEFIHQHPLFWKDHLKLEYLCKISERIYNNSMQQPETVLLQINEQSVIGRDFSVRLCPHLKNLLAKARYDTNDVYELIRLIRNKKAHYHDDVHNGVATVGALPTGFLSYFTEKFPELLTHMFAAMQYMAHGPSTDVSIRRPNESV